jgi:hypothetical protein
MSWMTGDQLPTGTGNCFFLFTTMSRLALGAHPASYPMCTRGSLPGGLKWPGCETEHSPPSSAAVKNVWSYTATVPYVSMVSCLIKHRDNFSFLSLLYLKVLCHQDVVPRETWLHIRLFTKQSVYCGPLHTVSVGYHTQSGLWLP